MLSTTSYRNVLTGFMMIQLSLMHGQLSATTLTLFDSSEDNQKKWRIVNDTVMGGRSNSSITHSPEDGTEFSGTVSLENYGGFASVRGPMLQQDLSEYTGIEITVMGDGKRYACNLRTDGRFDGIAHRRGFETTEGKWKTIRIPFTSFVPTFRGQRLPERMRLQPGRMMSVGFIISDKQEGPFSLKIKSIKAY